MRNRNNKQIIIFIIIVSIIAVFVFMGYAFSLENNGDNPPNNNSDVVTYSALFQINGATYLEKNKITCIVQNNVCLITMPKALRDDWEVLGYHTNPNSHEASFKVNQQINLTSDVIFYVISKKDLQLQIIDNELDYISNKNNYCSIYNDETSCKVLVPFYNKKGYEVRGYSTNKASLTGIVYPSFEYELKNDVTLYPIYNTLTRGKVINITNTTSVGNMVIDIENGCSKSIYDEYIKYFETIDKKAPYLSIGSKISFLTDNTFDSIWGQNYVGMNYGPKNLRLFDVRCSNIVINNYYATIVHELAHTWDFYYSNFMDKDITEQSDVINLFNKYKNMSNRPFRDYSYTDIKEFFADMVRYYYLKYTDPISGYMELSYPSDIETVLKKYICIANNGYKDNMC